MDLAAHLLVNSTARKTGCTGSKGSLIVLNAVVAANRSYRWFQWFCGSFALPVCSSGSFVALVPVNPCCYDILLTPLFYDLFLFLRAKDILFAERSSSKNKDNTM